MFDIFRKKTTLHLDVFTPVAELIDLLPIKLAREVMPEWYKKLPATVNHRGPERGTMKTCPGVVDLFKAGFVVPSWRDIYLEINSGVVNTFPEQSAEMHPSIQWGTGFPDYSHAKLISPWKIQEKTGVKFLWSNAFWFNNTDNYFVPSGVVEYKYQHTTNVNLLINKKRFPNKFTINAGEILAQVIPMTEQNVKLHFHAVSEEEYATKFYTPQYTFVGQYFKRKKALEKIGK